MTPRDPAPKGRPRTGRHKRLRLPTGIVGESAPIRATRDLLERVAQTSTSVLITGETGTGKELAARAIHEHSPRRSNSFVAINCAAIPEGLLESDLFGHSRGAFTGATGVREGLLKRADGGTVLLDEVGDMPLGLQAKLLRSLQEGTVRPVGSDTEQLIDIRVISATHCDLLANVRAGRFREDLLYRLNVVRIDLPPLRVRGDDVILLARHFLRHFAQQNDREHVVDLSPGVIDLLRRYSWPGNVRELRNCIERAVALTRHEVLLPEDLPAILDQQPKAQALPDPAGFITLAELERRYIFRVLDATHGNKTQAARILGLDRRTLYRRLDTYGDHTDQ